MHWLNPLTITAITPNLNLFSSLGFECFKKPHLQPRLLGGGRMLHVYRLCGIGDSLQLQQIKNIDHTFELLQSEWERSSFLQKSAISLDSGIIRPLSLKGFTRIAYWNWKENIPWKRSLYTSSGNWIYSAIDDLEVDVSNHFWSDHNPSRMPES